MLWLSHEDVARCGPSPLECIGICERALAAKARGEAELPPKLGVSAPGSGVLHAMPARVGEAVGMKWISIYPQRKPPIAGIVVLNDRATGEIVAVLDAKWITAARTGACAALAARQLARAGAETVGIVGPGLQARSALAALRGALPGIRDVRAFAPNQASAAAFAKETGARAVAAVEEAVDADVVVTAAPWPSRAPPPIRPEWIRRSSFVCALDYDASISAQCAARFDHRFADDVAQLRLARGKGSFAGWPDDFVELHGASRARPDETILCANLGIAILDVAMATAVVERARSRGIGRVV
jgi:ornithine cyclodeaminase/alanine dehydrogenase